MTLHAYNRSTLPRLGYTYDRAMSVPAIVICLAHMERHRQHRASDTIYCTCGKSWDVTDTPPEGCTR